MSKLSDYHMHTNCSFDGFNTADEMCQKAISENLRAIGFTDHFEVRRYINNDMILGDHGKNIKRSFEEISLCKERYKDQLDISFGIEIGEPCADLETVKHLESLYKFDFIMASIHDVKGECDFYLLRYTNETIPYYLKIYFDEVLNTVKHADFDIFGHLTYPYRYIKGREGFDIDDSLFSDIIDEILKTIISRGKAIEINTSTLRQGMNEPMPHKNIVKRFKELGGEYITFGSDAHKVEDLGKGLDEAKKIAFECGFNYYTIYKNRKPQNIIF